MGARSKGYWSYKHLVLQLKDCVDCLKVLYPVFEFGFLFDHSRGYDCSKEDGLKRKKMNTGWEGKQAKINEFKILKVEGYL